MKRIFTIITIATFLSSCAAKVIPLKGNYPETPIVTTTSNSFDIVWDKLVDLFAQQGLSIKIIDRSSGLIISNGKLATTYEDNKGVVLDKEAYVAVPTQKDPGNYKIVPISGYHSNPKTGKIIPNDVFGEWNVRIKKTETGTSINVNLVNLYYESIGMNKVILKNNLYSYKSTGVFEKSIADLIK